MHYEIATKRPIRIKSYVQTIYEEIHCSFKQVKKSFVLNDNLEEISLKEFTQCKLAVSAEVRATDYFC